jgi:Domain of unknown function (DUF4214)
MQARSDRSTSSTRVRPRWRRGAAVSVVTVGLLLGSAALSAAPASALPPTHVADCTGSASPARRWVALVYIRALFRCESGPDSELGIMHFDPDSVRGSYTRGVFRSTEASRKWAAQAFELFLGRNPDASGSAFWTNRLHTGTRYDEFESGLIGSNEYFHREGSTNANFVDGAYQDLLQRTPSVGETAYWVGRLTAGANRGSVTLTIDRSSERRRIIADLWGYGYVLHRSASSADLNFWAAKQATGIDQLDLSAAFTASPEAIRKANTPGF